MTAKVFIDGEAGTTGLQIRDRLMGRSDVDLISLADDRRKDMDARLEAFGMADVGILCLPDASVHELMPHLDGMDVKIIDASTAHRVDPDWAYGFAELAPEFRTAIESASRVSNPGCYPTGALALIRPLVDAGILAPDAAVTINAVSGYTGGGKSLIAEFESGETDSYFAYGLGQSHKHLPEIQRYSRLETRPVFVPSVGNYAQGMAVQVPLAGLDRQTSEALEPALRDHYGDSTFVTVVTPDHYGGRIDPRHLNGTNRLELSVHGDPAAGAMVLVAVLDNLGKGASGAAVQNLNILLGLDETTGL